MAKQWKKENEKERGMYSLVVAKNQLIYLQFSN